MYQETLPLTWQEVVAHQHAEQHKIVDDALRVIGEALHAARKFSVQVVPQKADLEEDEVLGAGVVQGFARGAPAGAPAEVDDLAQQAEVGLVGDLQRVSERDSALERAASGCVRGSPRSRC